MAIPSSKVSAKLRTRWHHFRLDMTPMVDMAFLLLTFLLLHAAYAKPHVMQLTMPVNDTDGNRQAPCMRVETITIILGKNHLLHYYSGLNNLLDHSIPAPDLRTTNFSNQGIRKVLLLRRSQQPEPVILIKPTPAATYRDVIDILDEMHITGQRKYALVKISANDTKLLHQAGY